MIFNNMPKVKIIKLPLKPNHVRVVHGSHMGNIDIDYADYQELTELRTVLMNIFDYMGLGEIKAHFGSNHFCILINDKEILRVADVSCTVDDE